MLTTIMYLDLGAGFGPNGLDITVAQFRDIDGAATFGTGSDLEGLGPVGEELQPDDVLNFRPLQYDFNHDGVFNQQDTLALQNEVARICRMVLEPFDIDVVTVQSTSAAAVRAVLARNDPGGPAFNGRGQNDAYNFVIDARSDRFTGVNKSVGDWVYDNAGLFGIAAASDLFAQLGNDLDEATLTFADTIFGSVPFTQGTAAFDEALVFRLAYTAIHEAGHTWTLIHTTSANAAENQLTSGDQIRFGSATRDTFNQFYRFSLERQAGLAYNNYDFLAQDPDIGLRDTDRDGTPDVAYVTGTGANDLIRLTNVGAGRVLVTVTPHTDAARTTVSRAAPNSSLSYFIFVGQDTEGTIRIDTGPGDDHVIIDPTIQADFVIRDPIFEVVTVPADGDSVELEGGQKAVLHGIEHVVDSLGNPLFGGFGGTISGVVFDDVNRNGRQDVGELGIAGATVTLDGGADTDTTSATGRFVFNNVDLGSHSVTFTPGAGQTLTFPTSDHTVFFHLDPDRAINLNFGVAVPASGEIQGVKFRDDDGDGLQGGLEPGLGGFLIYVDANNNGQLDATEVSDVTNAAGAYTLSNVLLGTHIVREVQQPNFRQTAPTSGFHTVVLATAGQVVTGIDFGNQPSGTVSGVKFRDDDGDGVRDVGEVGLAGFVIYSDANGNDAFDVGEISTTTAADGSYTLTLPIGAHTIREEQQFGFTQTAPASGEHAINIIVAGQTFNNRDFGNQRSTGTINGVVFQDDNGDGVRQAGEPGLAGFVVYVDANNNGARDAGEDFTTSGATGAYSLVTGISLTALVVRQEPQPFFSQTVPAAGFYSVVVNTAGQVVNNRNFGNEPAGDIQGVVFEDKNQNTFRDFGEGGIAGITIYIDANNNGVLNAGERSTVTDAVGRYTFAGVRLGTHRLRQVLLPGLSQTFPTNNAPNVVNITAPGQVAQANFGDFNRNRPGFVQGHVYRDVNGNGARDPGETGVAGVWVYVDINNDGLIGGGEPAARTDANGDYAINFAASSFARSAQIEVRAVAPAGFLQTEPVGNGSQSINYNLALGIVDVLFGMMPTAVVDVVGDTLLVTGTAGDDTMTFRAGATSHTVTVNGRSRSINAAGIKKVRFAGGPGVDTINVYNGGRVDTIDLRPGDGVVTNSAFRVDATAEKINVFGQASDVAYLYDSAGNDRFVARATRGSMTGPGYANSASGVGKYYARATAGGNDRADFYDTAGNDTFVAWPNRAEMRGATYFASATGFDSNYGFATAGGFDTAVFYDSAGNDRYDARGDQATLRGAGFFNNARGFDRNNANATAGGVDRAYLWEVDAALDSLYGRDSLFRRTRSSRTDQASNFDTVATILAAQSAVNPTLSSNVRTTTYDYSERKA